MNNLEKGKNGLSHGSKPWVPAAKKIMKAINIEWDTDGVSPKTLGLPSKIEIPKEISIEEVEDYLSEVTGYCHKSYNLADIGTRTIRAQICMNWDDGDDIKELEFTVPEDVRHDDIWSAIHKYHNLLCKEEDNRYGTCGRTPETLCDYICEQNPDWQWKEIEWDIDVNLT